MGWFDILKLGGEDFGTPEINQELFYGDGLTNERLDFFHNLKNVATTRPHFEYSATQKYSDNIQGNLREITQKLQGESMVGSANSPPYMAFTAPDSKYLISFRRITPEENYTGSKEPSEFLDEFGKKRPTRPMDLGNTKSVIVFDSVYDAYDVGRLRQVFGSPLERLKSIWGDSDEDRLRGMMREKEQVNYQELIDKRAELTAKKRELIATQEKLQKKNRNRKMLPEQRKKNEARILQIDNEVDKIDAQVREIDNLTQRSKGRTRGPRRRRRR